MSKSKFQQKCKSKCREAKTYNSTILRIKKLSGLWSNLETCFEVWDKTLFWKIGKKKSRAQNIICQVVRLDTLYGLIKCKEGDVHQNQQIFWHHLC